MFIVGHVGTKTTLPVTGQIRQINQFCDRGYFSGHIPLIRSVENPRKSLHWILGNFFLSPWERSCPNVRLFARRLSPLSLKKVASLALTGFSENLMLGPQSFSENLFSHSLNCFSCVLSISPSPSLL